MRAIPFLLAAAALLPVAAPIAVSAQSAYGNYRVRTQVVYGSQPCPKSTNPDEVIVCARRPEEELYRISPRVRAEEKAKIAREDDVGAQRAALASGADSATGLGSNSAVGPGGAFGARAVTDVRTVVRNVREGVEKATEPTDP